MIKNKKYMNTLKITKEIKQDLKEARTLEDVREVLHFGVPLYGLPQGETENILDSIPVWVGFEKKTKKEVKEKNFKELKGCFLEMMVHGDVEEFHATNSTVQTLFDWICETANVDVKNVSIMELIEALNDFNEDINTKGGLIHEAIEKRILPENF